MKDPLILEIKSLKVVSSSPNLGNLLAFTISCCYTTINHPKRDL